MTLEANDSLSGQAVLHVLIGMLKQIENEEKESAKNRRMVIETMRKVVKKLHTDGDPVPRIKLATNTISVWMEFRRIDAHCAGVLMAQIVSDPLFKRTPPTAQAEPL